jgi:hypothetical protein
MFSWVDDDDNYDDDSDDDNDDGHNDGDNDDGDCAETNTQEHCPVKYFYIHIHTFTNIC